MKIYSVNDPEFKPYGKVLENYDTAELVKAMMNFPLPASGTAYRPSVKELEDCAIFKDFKLRQYGGMPIQLGICLGHNTKLNCLEYHRDTEINVGTHDFILLLAKMDDIVDGKLDTSKVKAFLAPAGAAVEIYATSLHYAPVQTNAADGFRTTVVLPKGTNTDKPDAPVVNAEDKWLFACNKWLIAHPEAPEVQKGACIGLTGENIDLA